jgi:hypothetical protein
MLKYLKTHPGAVFDPEDIRILSLAFEKAWEAVQASGAQYVSDAHAEAARHIIAKHIIEAAKQGERDQRRLRDGALVALAQTSLRTAAKVRMRDQDECSDQLPKFADQTREQRNKSGA